MDWDKALPTKVRTKLARRGLTADTATLDAYDAEAGTATISTHSVKVVASSQRIAVDIDEDDNVLAVTPGEPIEIDAGEILDATLSTPAADAEVSWYEVELATKRSCTATQARRRASKLAAQLDGLEWAPGG